LGGEGWGRRSATIRSISKGRDKPERENANENKIKIGQERQN